MARNGPPTEKPALEAIKEQFEHWRETREKRGPIPDELWDAAVSLCEDYPSHYISRALQLNYKKLLKRIESKEPPCIEPSETPINFVELDTKQSPLPLGVEWFVEMADANGAKLVMRYRGPQRTDLAEMARGLWEARR